MAHADKIAVFIDGPIVDAMSNSLGRRIDFCGVRRFLAQHSKLSSIKYYTYIDESNAGNPVVKLLDWLDYNGYRTFRKSASVKENLDGSKSLRGSILVEFTTDMILMAQHVDHVVVIGGRPENVYPVQHIKRMGVNVTLISTLKGDGFRPSDELRRAVDYFWDIETIHDAIKAVQESH